MATTLANISIKDSSSWNTYLNLIYPVGSYYLSNSSTSPSSRFGGSWTQIKDQRFLCGYTSITTGGANSVTLSVDQTPPHSHSIWVTTWPSALGGSGFACSNANSNYLANPNWESNDDPVVVKTGGGQESRKPTLVPHLLYVVHNCIIVSPLLEVI